MEKNRNDNSTNDHLANERTFLSWIRTSMAIMAFGFVVVKFSLFVKQLSLLVGKEIVDNQKEHSALMGIALVAVGVITTLLAYIQYRKTKQQIIQHQYRNNSFVIALLTTLIFIISGLLIVYLIENSSFYN